MSGFPLRLAWWEGRASIRRVGLYGLSITLGVAALVAVRSFREDVSRSVQEQARVLMGADAKFEIDRVVPDSLRSVVDSLEAAGARSAGIVRTVSMVAAEPSGGVRLLQVWSVDGAWPFYGDVTEEPAGAWRSVGEGRAVVDRAVLTQLQTAVGDSLTIGRTRVQIVGVVDDLPTEPGFQSAVGPRVWVAPATLDAAALLGFGSLARWDVYLASDDRAGLEGVDERYEELLEATGADYSTARQRARQLTRAVGFLGRYLGLVGLGALLLGGIGVASAIHVFVKERVTQVAVLRCLGARQNGIFVAYLLQAAALGFAGALGGVILGVGVQQLLPLALADVLPVDVETRISWSTAAAGLATGVGVAAVFALLPLLAVRDVPPLRAFRQSVEGGAGRWALSRLAAVAALAVAVLGLSIAEAPGTREGIAFAAGLAVATGVLWGVGRAAIGASRRLFPSSAPYPIRQGYSNLFRPGNQTVAVTLSLGFGAFIVGTVLQVQENLGRELSFEAQAGQPNLLLFDVQPDQREGIVDLLPAGSRGGAEVTPLVSARLVAIDGIDVETLRLDGAENAPEGWAVRREYRHTWRDTLTAAEAVVEGAWWPDAAEAPPGVARISMETSLAQDLAVGVGTRLTWSVDGLEVPSVVASLRTVDWERFQTNFFVVFEPGPLDAAPASWVILARVDGQEALDDVQRSLVGRFPNVSAVDLSRIQEAVESILARARQAASFLAGFAAVAGLLVLAGALAASRHQRLREGALLKTLGARRRQLLTVLFSEYVALGMLAAVSGLGLSIMAAWALVGGVFELPFVPSFLRLSLIAAAMVALTLVTGLLGSRGLLRRPPLPVLRELVD
ncbi:MAG: FtsX-like permease family protein [Gemmatimonadetes bacterium]|nr:FtsX-like permease family protein [Gemmatimonadota bacterium]